jgi:hypothetical protein
MEFKEFALKLGLEESNITAIGGLFDAAPNTVWNWKHRNSVPAKYVLEAINRKLFKRSQADKKAS